MKFNKVDNAIAVNDVKFLDLWYQAYNDVWGYMENNKIDMDMSYLSDPSFNAIQFYQSLAAIRISNDARHVSPFLALGGLFRCHQFQFKEFT